MPGSSRFLIIPRLAPMTKGRKKSKFHVELVSFRFLSLRLVLQLIRPSPNPFPFRTLAQRRAKRAKIPLVVLEDESPPTTGDVPETTLPDLAAGPQSSPQRSPQREYMVHSCCLAHVRVLLLFVVDAWLLLLGRSRAAPADAPGEHSCCADCVDYPAKGEI